MAMIEKITSSLGLTLGLNRSSQVFNVEPEEGCRFLTVGDSYTFIEVEGHIVPFLGCHSVLSMLPSAKVDTGALKFILNGADIMRPGIRSWDDWGPVGRVVVIRDEEKSRAIAVGRTLVESKEMVVKTRGACIQNLHHVGDKFWTKYKSI
jgi:PUA domain protein